MEAERRHILEEGDADMGGIGRSGEIWGDVGRRILEEGDAEAVAEGSRRHADACKEGPDGTAEEDVEARAAEAEGDGGARDVEDQSADRDGRAHLQ